MSSTPLNRVVNIDARELLGSLPDRSIDLLWTDPPFGMGKYQQSNQTVKSLDPSLARAVGISQPSEMKYWDAPLGKTIATIVDTMKAAAPKMKTRGVVAILLGNQAAHRVLVELYRQSSEFLYHGAITWHRELGGVPKSGWALKHDTILLLSLSSSPRFYPKRVLKVDYNSRYGFEESELNSQRAEGDCIRYTFASGSLSERVGYPGQKPIALVGRFILAHTRKTGLVVDPFCGSGTTAIAAKLLGRQFIVGDLSTQAIAVTNWRLSRGL